MDPSLIAHPRCGASGRAGGRTGGRSGGRSGGRAGGRTGGHAGGRCCAGRIVVTPPVATPLAPEAPPFSMRISGGRPHTVGLQQHIGILSVCAAVLGAIQGIGREDGRHQSVDGKVNSNGITSQWEWFSGSSSNS